MIQQLDTVVDRGVVRRRDDCPHCGSRFRDQMRDATRWQDADIEGVDTDGVQACLECLRQHLTGATRVTPDENGFATYLLTGRTTKCEGEVGRQFGIGDTADPVGTEQTVAAVEHQ